MSSHTTLSVVAAALVLAASHASAQDSFTDAFKNGEAHLDLRLRYEDVHQSTPANLDGDALTLRTRLNFKTAGFHGFTAFLEMDDVSA